MVVLTGGRSGSNYLQELMLANGFGEPNEYFHPGFGFGDAVRAGVSTEDWLDRTRRKHTRGRVFGLKMMHSHLALMGQHMRGGPRPGNPGLLLELLPGARYVWLRRRDRLRQAISLWRAWQTGEFRRHREQTPSSAEPELVPSDVDANLRYLEHADSFWDGFLQRCGTSSLMMFYEDLVAEPAARLADVLRYLDVRMPKWLHTNVAIVRQADALTERYLAQYLASRRASSDADSHRPQPHAPVSDHGDPEGPRNPA